MFVELKYFFNLAKAKQNKHLLNYFIMTTLSNTTMKNVIAKTSFEYGSLESDLMICAMGSGYTFIQAYKMSKTLQRINN